MRTSLAWLGCFGVIKGFNDLMDHHVTGGRPAKILHSEHIHVGDSDLTSGNQQEWEDETTLALTSSWFCGINLPIELFQALKILESQDSHLIYSNRRPGFSLVPRPRPSFRRLQYWKQWKAGRGLGMRLG